MKFAVIINDIHLKMENAAKIELLFKEALIEAESTKYMFILGDIFHSRIAQRIEVLNSFKRMLDKAYLMDINIIAIPGNHDKTNYDSEDSFLDSFEYHPALDLITSPSLRVINNIDCHFIPFFKEELWYDLFQSMNELITFNDKPKFLFTHIAVNGSVNNDGSVVRTNLNLSLFEKFDQVFSGHYHNHQVIGKFVHLPSICQDNFGEDTNKGCTILHTDGKFEIKNLNFDTYHTLVIDLDKISKKAINTIIDDKAKEYTYLRIEFKGDESQLKSIDRALYTSKGIDVRFKLNNIQEEELIEEYVKFTKDNILDEFKKWCDKENKEYDQGFQYLKKQLNG